MTPGGLQKLRTPYESVVLVIPALNEESTISAVVRGARELGLAVIVVDDGSSDQTARLAEDSGATVLHHQTALGVGAAYRTAFHHIQRYSACKYVATMDADQAHEPADLKRLIATCRKANAAVTIGSRFTQHSLLSDLPSAKRAANRFAASIINGLTGLQLTDVASGLRVLSREVLDLPFTASGFGAVYETILLAHTKGLRITEVPCHVFYDAEEVFCTARPELLDFLSLVEAYAPANSILRSSIRWLRERVERREVARLVVGNYWLVVHPLQDYDAVIFQEQSPRFVRAPAEWKGVG